MQTLLDKTLEYTKMRKQFGRPLSANQVIRHRLADMAMQCDEARSIALRAALMADADPVARGRAASGAKAKIGKCARFVAEQSVQLHGAMGVTEELDIGAYFKRLLAFDTLFGGSAHHYRRHAALGGRPASASWSGASHGSHLQRRRARLRKRSPRLHRAKPDAGNEARDRADAVGVLRPGYRHGLAARAAQEGLGRAGMAGGIWRTGLDARRSAGSSRPNAPAPACRMSTSWASRWSAPSSSASARRSRRISICRGFSPARTIGARAIPSRAPAPISPR